MGKKVFHLLLKIVINTRFGLILGIFIFISRFSIFSQANFEFFFTSRNHDEVCGPITCTPEGEIFFILWKAEKPDLTFTNGSSFLYKITDYGDTLCWNFQKPDTILYFLALLYDKTGNLVIGGDAWSLDTAGNKNSKFQWFCKLTTDFEIIWEKEYRIQTTGLFNQNQSILVDLPNNQYLYANSIIPDTSYTNYTYLFKLDSNGDSILFFHNNDELKHSSLTSITLSSDSSSIGLHLFGGYSPPDYSNCKYFEYDTLFQLIQNQWYTNPDYGEPYSTMNYSESGFISCGTYWPYERGSYPERFIRVMKMNEDLTLSDYIDLTYPDPEKPTYAAWKQSIDFINPERIFVGGMEDKGSTLWNTNPSWIYLACLNNDLDLIYEEYIGGDALYATFYIKATYDGGVILTGSIYNDSIQDYERDGFLMKFDSNFFVSTPELGSRNCCNSINLFPNPGHELLTVSTSNLALEFELYNSIGNKLITIPMPDHVFTIETTSLPSGIYFWVVKFSNSIFSSGKWIKI